MLLDIAGVRVMSVGAADHAELKGVDADSLLFAQPFDEGVPREVHARLATGAPDRARADVFFAIVRRRGCHIANFLKATKLVLFSDNVEESVLTFRLAFDLHDLDQPVHSGTDTRLAHLFFTRLALPSDLKQASIRNVRVMRDGKDFAAASAFRAKFVELIP